MLEQLELGSNINILYLEETCTKCNKKLNKKNIELKYEEFTESKWQKECLMYCDGCNSYYLTIFKLDEFKRKYPSYLYIKEGKTNPNKMEKVKCYQTTNRAKHFVCMGKVVKDKYIREELILVDKKNKIHYFEINKCPQCGNYIINKQDALEIKNNTKECEIISANEIEMGKANNFQQLNFQGIRILLTSSSKLNIVSDNCCKMNHDSIELNFKVPIEINNKMRIMKELHGLYCKNCEMYIVNQNEFDLKIAEKLPDCDLYVNGKKNVKEKIKKVDYIDMKVSNKINNENKADFFVRTNVISCVNKKHNIEEVTAEIDIIKHNGEVYKQKIPAFYCSECNLYFIYNNQYERIKRNGVPLCPIYEYNKYLNVLGNNMNLNQESLLHSFGYNVGSAEDLSSKQRQRILRFVVENGIIDKHKIIALLNYFIDMRKGQMKFNNAIKKWNDDINYLNLNKINLQRNIKISSIKISRAMKKN